MIRMGLYSFGAITVIFFMLVILSGDIPENEINKVFEDIDTNKLDKLDANVTYDANLAKFVKYSVRGIGHELHGTYYLAAWARTWLPEWLVANSELVVVLAILLILAPLIGSILHIVLLVFLACCLWLHDKIKERRLKNEA